MTAYMDRHTRNTAFHDVRRRSQNAEKVTQIKGRLLDQARILFNWILFRMGTSLKGKNLLPEGVNSFLDEHFLIVWKITCVLGAMPMSDTTLLSHIFSNCLHAG